MKKSDLKTGMLIELGNGDVCLVVNDTFLYSDDGWDDINTLGFDHCEKSLQIKRVSSVLSMGDLTPSNWNSPTIDKNLLWENWPDVFEIDGVEYSKTTLRNLIRKATNK